MSQFKKCNLYLILSSKFNSFSPTQFTVNVFAVQTIVNVLISTFRLEQNLCGRYYMYKYSCQ